MCGYVVKAAHHKVTLERWHCGAVIISKFLDTCVNFGSLSFIPCGFDLRKLKYFWRCKPQLLAQNSFGGKRAFVSKNLFCASDFNPRPNISKQIILIIKALR